MDFSTLLFIAIVVIGIYKLLHSQGTATPFEATFDSTLSVGNFLNHGFSLGSHTLYATEDDSDRHCMVVGTTGAKKTTSCYANSVCNILKRTDHSIFGVQPSRDAFTYTAGFAHEKGRNVFEIDFTNPNAWGFNVLDEVNSVQDITNVVSTLVENSEAAPKGGDFWKTSAKDFISFWVRVILTYPKEYRTFSNVLRLIEYFAIGKTDELIVKIGDPDLLRTYKTYVANSPNTMQGIVSQAKSCLSCYANPTIQRTTSVAQSISLNTLRFQSSYVVLTSPITAYSYIRPIISTFVEAMYNRFLSYIPDFSKEKKIYMLLDEVGNYRLQNLPMYLATARKHGLPSMLILQQKTSLIGMYSKSEYDTICANSNLQVYLPPVIDLETTTELSKRLGTHTRKDEDDKKMRHALLTPAEISRLDKAIVINGSKTTLATVKPYYTSTEFSRYSKLPVPEIETTFPDEVPLITL
ncbi:MAG: type IV secretory system conjugative DNA transfer family protein [Flavipsychrobacter sp.]